MEQLRKKDFENLLLNCYDISDDDDIFKVFPILSKYPVFTKKIPYRRGSDLKADVEEIFENKTRLIKYIIFVYDPGSPFQKITDTLERRAEAAQFAGYEVKDKKFDEVTDKMIRCIIPEVNRMIVQFCMLTQEDDYATLIVYRERLRKELESLSDADIESKDVSKVIANIKAFEKEIVLKKESLLANNMDSFINKTLFEYMESKRLKLTPEDIAKALIPWDNISVYYKNVKLKL